MEDCWLPPVLLVPPSTGRWPPTSGCLQIGQAAAQNIDLKLHWGNICFLVISLLQLREASRVQASLCAGGAGDDGPVALPPLAVPGARHAPSHTGDQLERQRGAQHAPAGPRASPGGHSCLRCYSLTLAQIQAFLLGFGLPLRKRHGDQEPRWLQFLKRPELCGACCLIKWRVGWSDSLIISSAQ